MKVTAAPSELFEEQLYYPLCLTFIMFCSKRRIHDDRVKGTVQPPNLCQQVLDVALHEVHVGDVKLLHVAGACCQGLLINVHT